MHHRMNRPCFSLVLLAGSLAMLPVRSRSQALPSAPTTADATPDLAEIRLKIDRGQPAEALKQLDVLAAQPKVPAGVNRLRGLALYSENQFVEADAAFASALKQDPHDLEAAQLRGLTLFRLGRPADAIPLLESAHTWNSHTKVDPSYVLALCYIDTHQYDNARHAFAAQYGLEPDSAPAYLLAARMLLRREYLAIAQQFAAKAIALDPRLPMAHQLLGEIELADEHMDASIRDFEQERQLNPLNGSVYDRLGDAYARAGDYTRAEQSLERALLLEPDSTGPYILLGKVLLHQNDPANAVMYLERAEKMDPGNYRTHALLAQAYGALGSPAKASSEAAMAQKILAGSESALPVAH